MFTWGRCRVHGWSVLVNANTPGQLIIGSSNSGSGIITTTAAAACDDKLHINATAAFGTTSAVDLAADVAGGPPFTHVSERAGINV